MIQIKTFISFKMKKYIIIQLISVKSSKKLIALPNRSQKLNMVEIRIVSWISSRVEANPSRPYYPLTYQALSASIDGNMESQITTLNHMILLMEIAVQL